MESKVSFTIRRPTPVSRAESSDSESFKIPALPRHLINDSAPGSPLARSSTSSPNPHEHDPDSSDEENGKLQDELVTGFDQFGVQRLNPQKKPQGPLVIPAQQNKDWRALARKRRGQTQYVPESARATTGKDGSVGGLGTRDVINNGPVLVGLHVPSKPTLAQQPQDVDMGNSHDTQKKGDELDVKQESVVETEDEAALRAVLASIHGGEAIDGPIVDIIAPVGEKEAFLQDVEELPDNPTLDDYARVPVSQFGAALLRGMGWTEGTAASRKKGKGLVEPYLPESRPSLLGIGAKERIVDDDGSKKKLGSKRPERRYVPVVKMQRESSNNDTLSRSNSRSDEQGPFRRERSRSPHSTSSLSKRRRSRSRSPAPRRDRDRQYDADRRRGHESDRKGYHDYDSNRRRDYERDGERDNRKDRDYSRSTALDSGRDSERRRDRSSERKTSSRRRD